MKKEINNKESGYSRSLISPLIILITTSVLTAIGTYIATDQNIRKEYDIEYSNKVLDIVKSETDLGTLKSKLNFLQNSELYGKNNNDSDLFNTEHLNDVTLSFEEAREGEMKNKIAKRLYSRYKELINDDKQKAYSFKDSSSYMLYSALVHFTKSIESDPQHGESYSSRAFSYFRLGRQIGRNSFYNSAIKDYKKSISFNPENNYVYYMISLSFENLNQLDSALIYARKAQDLDPHFENYTKQVLFLEKEILKIK